MRIIAAALCLAVLTGDGSFANDRDLCRDLANALFRISQDSQALAERIAAPNYDNVVGSLDVGTRQREAMTAYRDDAYKVLAALKGLSDRANATSKIMKDCAGD